MDPLTPVSRRIIHGTAAVAYLGLAAVLGPGYFLYVEALPSTVWMVVFGLCACVHLSFAVTLSRDARLASLAASFLVAVSLMRVAVLLLGASQEIGLRNVLAGASAWMLVMIYQVVAWTQRVMLYRRERRR